MPDSSDTMPGAPPPDSDPDGAWGPVENNVVDPTDPAELGARILSRFTFPRENPMTGMLVLRLDCECLIIFTFIRAIKKACVYVHILYAE